MSTEVVRKPHTVSQVVLRGFCKGRRLVRYSVLTGDDELVGTRRMGVTREIPLDRAPKFEKVWQKLEVRLDLALDLVRRGAAHKDPKTVEVLRDCVAIHMARTIDVMAVNREFWAQAAEPSIRSLAADPRTAESFRRRRGIVAATGLHKAVGEKRWPLDRIAQGPSVWRIDRHDAEVILDALGEEKDVGADQG